MNDQVFQIGTLVRPTPEFQRDWLWRVARVLQVDSSSRDPGWKYFYQLEILIDSKIAPSRPRPKIIHEHGRYLEVVTPEQVSYLLLSDCLDV